MEACTHREDSVRGALVAVVLGLSWTSQACATGFFINQQSVKGLARVDAGNSVAADELGTIFFNPAGLIPLWDAAGTTSDPPRGLFAAGVHVIVPRSKLRNTGSSAETPGTLGTGVMHAGEDGRNPTDPALVPNIYGTMPVLNGSAAIGFGVNAPFGLATEFSPSWFGRYDAIDASLRTINFSVVGAYRASAALSIGAGLNLQYVRTTLSQAVPNPLAIGGPSVATDARVSSVGHDWSPGVNVGLIYEVGPAVRVGLHYRSGIKHRITGQTTFSGFAGPLASANGTVGATTELRLPAIGTLGIRYQHDAGLALFGELAWYDWSRFDVLRTRFADGRPDAVRETRFKDAYGVAFGAEQQLSGRWAVRGGVHADTTPTRDGFRDTTVPDASRLWLGLGGTYRSGPGRTVDFAVNHVIFRGTDVGLTRDFFEGTPLASRVRIDSSVRSVVNTVAVDFRWAF